VVEASLAVVESGGNLVAVPLVVLLREEVAANLAAVPLVVLLREEVAAMVEEGS